MRASTPLFSVLGVLLWSACSSDATEASPAAGTPGSDAGTASSSAPCTKQPLQLTEANCETATLYDLYACAEGASPPSADCKRTPIKDAYCCFNAVITDAGPAKPRAIVHSELSGSPGCAGAFVDLGTFSPSAPVYDGDANGTAVVKCLVTGADGAFDVTASARVSALGSVELTGRLQPSDPAGTLDAVFDRKGTTIKRSKCTVTYPETGGSAEGRVWVNVTCPTGAGAEPESCAVTAQVRFENCLP